MPQVTFQPGDVRLEVSAGTTLLAATLRAGRPIGYACRGRGVCVSCRVRVEGDVEPPTPGEARLLETLPTPTAYRIACLCRVAGDCRVRADYW